MYLIKTTEVFRADSEQEAHDIVNAAKEDHRFVIAKYAIDYKPVKSKGEIVDEYWLVTLAKQITDQKEPDRKVEITYNEV